ncbi:rod shape-determining protein MreC [Aquimarina agarilytica]|uniref:rod shape-determining protein MreC n=1 Tax=Aquimarina agarilytica TaxID=1087449 RepID=UPI00028932DB|nr:rod shape-determining protein MreC [Aquimarina agarilytica]
MQQIINFLIRYRNTLLFIILFTIAFGLTIQSHSYHKSKFISSTSFLTGGLFSVTSNIDNYFSLKAYNNRLLIENAKLKNALQQKGIDTTSINTLATDSSATIQYHYKPALVINNNYHKTNNFITLNKGKKDSIDTDMGVITDLGIVGIVQKASTNYSRVISILNKNSRINAKLKKTNHFGSLVWNTKSPNIVQLIDIPRLAPLKIGDTIVTGGRSTIFPKGILIGAIKDFQLDTNESYYTVNIKLFNDMTNIGFVNVIENKNATEIKAIEKQTNE